MQSTWKVSAWLCGLGILLAPAVVQSAVVYRTSGAACKTWVGTAGMHSPESGFVSFVELVPPRLVCALPTSDDTFLPTTLTQVNVRYYFGGSATVTGRIVFHDYDSPDFVECGEDADTFTTNGYRTLEIPKSCNSSTYASNWAAVAAVETSNMHFNELLNVKLISVER